MQKLSLQDIDEANKFKKTYVFRYFFSPYIIFQMHINKYKLLKCFQSILIFDNCFYTAVPMIRRKQLQSACPNF